MRCNQNNKAKQKGAVLLLLLLVALVGGTAFFLATQSPQHARQKAFTSDLEKLLIAKKALIAYAAFQNTPNTPEVDPDGDDSPGELLCPDRNNDGISNENDGDFGQCFSYAGHLPYITLDIEELRDSSGNRFWYAVSDNYQTFKNGVLNSSTGTDLFLNDNPVVAVVIAPGEPVNAFQQGRPAVDDATNFAENLVDFYLDLLNGDGDPTEWDQAATQTARDASSYYTIDNNPGGNDIVIGITATELWQQASSWPLQRARAGLQAYYIANGNVPFAKDDNNNCAAGGLDLLAGLLPIDTGAGNCIGAVALNLANLDVPANPWFVNNLWHQQIFYTVSPDCVPGAVAPCTAGAGIQFDGQSFELLLIDSGAALEDVECSAGGPFDQADPRNPLPAGNICDYLELNENTDLDVSFDKPASNQLSNDNFLGVYL